MIQNAASHFQKHYKEDSKEISIAKNAFVIDFSAKDLCRETASHEDIQKNKAHTKPNFTASTQHYDVKIT